MIIFKKNRLLNEIVFIGLLIYIFILVANSLRIEGISALLPNKITIFEIMKNYFISITLLIVIEYFVAYDLPQNYLFSRLFGVFVMITFTLIVFNLYSKSWVFNNVLAINLIYITAIVAGSIASYYVQRIKLNRSLILGVTNYIIFASVFVILSLISPIGYIFEV